MNGRPRSDDGVNNPQSPEAGTDDLLLDGCNGYYDSTADASDATAPQGNCLVGKVASLFYLKQEQMMELIKGMAEKTPLCV